VLLCITLRHQEAGKKMYKLFITDPYHPSLYFKRVHSQRPIFSVRITKDYRALGVLQNDDLLWFWIGSHLAYDKLLRQFWIDDSA
jgi:hypothetical protein